MPVRRAAAVLTATALAAGPAALLVAVPAHATGGHGKAGAVVLRTGLDVKLLNKAHVPLNATLNEVHAPASAEKTALSVKLDGVGHGKPFSVLRADVATARATAEARKSEGYANLVRAKVHVPGLPLLSLIEVQQVTSKVVCETGKRPTAESNVLGSVLVLGKKVTLRADGTTKVDVPDIGEVRLDLSKTETTSRTAAATALDLKVSVNPKKLNVAKVHGRVTLAEATCESPKGAPQEGQQQEGQQQEGQPQEGQPQGEQPQEGQPQEGQPTAGTTEAPDISTQTGSTDEKDNLAETGGSSATPYLAGGAALLIGAGGALMLVRRRQAASRQG
ncbi:SCO1860 family LAETG-anchored protein [Streptomyces sp. NPDC004647]|uniref:SCO1860 family LAETG-anchored protein n=1 Tax=Streptomyces sp. NPDC004647 TaxID=3154671 RepID=UPI0033A9C2A8